MQVHRVENDDSVLIQLIFINTGGENFKAAIKVWIQANYPTVTFETIFDRLLKFDPSTMVVDMA